MLSVYINLLAIPSLSGEFQVSNPVRERDLELHTDAD